MLKLLAKAFKIKTKSERDVASIQPLVTATLAEYARLTQLSDDQLREKTVEIKATIQRSLAGIDQEISAAQNQANMEADVSKKEQLYQAVDKLQKDRNKKLEVVLLEQLPLAFAVVKETARRFKENTKLVVTANMHDKALAARKANVVIEGEKATWHNKWMAAGNELTWEMLHYDVQLIGGIVLHQGKISEMATGEGKTLVATLPAYLNALAGQGVHIVTVNDYLAKRDSEWMAPLFEFHGLTVDCIDKHEANSEARRNAYSADITYGTNNEFGFDYLRDNMARSPEELVQRKLHYAMVDEVDSVLIDDARTPLIISGPVGKSDEQDFYELKPRVSKLVDAQKKLANDYLVQAKKLIAEKNEKEGGISLFRAFRALPGNKALIKYLSEPGIRAILQKTENIFLESNQQRMPEADAPLYFVIDEKNNSVDLTDKGIDYITGESEDPMLFVMPDINLGIAAIEKDNSLSGEEKLHAKEALLKDYSIKSQRIHVITQLLKAYTLFEKDIDYIIVENKVKIVDEQTGRVMEGRRYSDGLHQALEAKENVKVEEATQTYATITLQNYFRMYHKLAGMTGTAETESAELWDIYKLDVVVIPTNKSISRKDMEDKVYKTTREKFNAVVEEIVDLTSKGRPVLVGTTSVENSELLSRMLKMRNIQHQVLNAKLHKKEADIVAEAGKSGTVTIATNMAGRGTDIKLTPESKAAGGLAIIGTERHESRRVDRQLRGRSGRQGDPGSSQFFVSLEDSLMRLFGSERIAKLMDTMGLKEGEVIQHSLITSSIERAQKKVEENNFAQRKRLLEYDNVMNSQRVVIYTRRRNALFGDRLQLDVLSVLYSTCSDLLTNTAGSYSNFQLAVISTFGFNTSITEADYSKKSDEQLVDKLYDEVYELYEEKYKKLATQSSQVFKEIHQNQGDRIRYVMVPFTDGLKHLGTTVELQKVLANPAAELRASLERNVSLAFIDMGWKEHLREMDDLKQAVHTAYLEQKDPLIIYKGEGYDLFNRFMSKLNMEMITFLFKAEIETNNPADIQEARQQKQREKVKTQKEEAGSVLGSGPRPNPTSVVQQEEKQQPVKAIKVAGRNDKVNVQYMDGTIKREVKFKTVEDDIANNRCVLID
ncbi:MAG: preprotein translocase subunit SecA [Cytophagaceae bacterium]|jgi:preprotein translocase subunit SecA|nr:preprotein translocase subunit SecA [Cytophagaceae bacterium]